MSSRAEVTGKHISRADTDFYKGVGILLIVLHNYFHWVRPNTGENEFGFNVERTQRLIDGLSWQPLESANLLLDYFGHYGVQVFVFLSAYGLARAYAERDPRWITFMLGRIARIYPVFLLAIVAHFIFVVTPWSPDAWWFVKAYLLKLSTLSAFVPDMQFSLVGPWWFFPFIVQFYAAFPLLNALVRRHGTWTLIAIGSTGVVASAALNPWLTDHGVNLYVTVVGHLPVLCLGIYLARCNGVAVSGVAAALAAVVFVAGWWSRPPWLLAPVCVTVALLYVLPRLAGVIGRWRLADRFVRHCGVVSLPLFAIHGLIRDPFTSAANAQGQWWSTLAGAAAFLALSLVAAQAMV